MSPVLKFSLLIIWALTSACQSLYVDANSGGTQPINEDEVFEIQKAVNRCQKSGGTRVVKIKGALRCY